MTSKEFNLDNGLEFARACATQAMQKLNGVKDPQARLRETGVVGEGGDKTLELDRVAEDCVFAELDRLHAAGWSFTALSEERGRVVYGGDNLVIVIDPVDGSLNAKRSLWPHCMSIAVASGPLMQDVFFGYVLDFSSGEEWYAYNGLGAYCADCKITPAVERRCNDGRLEVVAIESADPRWIAERINLLQDNAHRVRAFGSIALSLCQLAAGRVDAMVSLWRCRSVDVAAAQLIVRESGGYVDFPAFGDEPFTAPLDLVPHSSVVAARSVSTLETLSLS